MTKLIEKPKFDGVISEEYGSHTFWQIEKLENGDSIVYFNRPREEREKYGTYGYGLICNNILVMTGEKQGMFCENIDVKEFTEDMANNPELNWFGDYETELNYTLASLKAQHESFDPMEALLRMMAGGMN